MKTAFILLLLCTFSLKAAAQIGGHTHKGAHKGIVQEASGYHIEMVKSKNDLVFYIAEAEENPSLKISSGTVEFELPGKSRSQSVLQESSAGYLTAAFPKDPAFLFCTVAVHVNGKKIFTRFKNPTVPQPAATGHGHQH